MAYIHVPQNDINYCLHDLSIDGVVLMLSKDMAEACDVLVASQQEFCIAVRLSSRNIESFVQDDIKLMKKLICMPRKP